MIENLFLLRYNEMEQSERTMGLFVKKESQKKGKVSRCAYCDTPFQTLAGSFYVARQANDISGIVLHMRKGCKSCGIPVCFNCAADAAEQRGMKGHCICPSCGAKLD